VKPLSPVSVLAICLGLPSVPLTAQQVVHALTGTVTAIDNNAKTITVFEDNGFRAEFPEMTEARTSIDFDKKVAAQTTTAHAFDKSGAYAIVFYYGNGSDRIIVALKDLGPGPFAATVGTVKSFDGHAHSIQVEDGAGKVQTFKIAPETVGETYNGVVEGMKFQARKGDRVRVVSTALSDTPTALFIVGS
jgi:hypothetical protein